MSARKRLSKILGGLFWGQNPLKMGNYTILQMFENHRRGRQARNFTTNAQKILDLKSSSEQIFSRKLQLGAPVYNIIIQSYFEKGCWKKCARLGRVIWYMINTLCPTLQLSNLLLLLSFSTRKHTSMASYAILSNFFSGLRHAR